MFWDTIKPFLINKTSNSRKVSLKKDDKLVTDESDVANVLNKYFIKSRGSAWVLDINEKRISKTTVLTRFQQHQSITSI